MSIYDDEAVATPPPEKPDPTALPPETDPVPTMVSGLPLPHWLLRMADGLGLLISLALVAMVASAVIRITWAVLTWVWS